MRRLPSRVVRLAWVSLIGPALAVAPARAERQVSASVQVRVEVHARTTLQVSARDLWFDVPADGTSATAALRFRAAARTGREAEVVLTIEPERWIEGPGGASDLEAEVWFTGEGEGTLRGTLEPSVASPVARWTGSGARTGQLRFTLRVGEPGVYYLPVRVVLSAP